jgi:chromosomal replication initiation ATPase DnaA
MNIAEIPIDDLITELKRRKVGGSGSNVLHEALADKYAEPVKQAVAKAFCVLPEQVFGARGCQRVSNARIASYIILRRAGLSLNEIAFLTNRACHTTVIKGIARAEDLGQQEPEFLHGVTEAFREVKAAGLIPTKSEK